ncbi:MAG: histidinol-phosphate aminotransferase family protein, partial [Thermoplasmata archaeon]|nr:histidinol-phosphate aminotransferase family protein [Thermoplasmata archaeon]
IIESGAKMIFISSPNNPTGNSMAREDILRLIDESNAIIVLDEAYVDFTDGSGSLETVSEAENVLILRTFSKAYALPGLRIGFGIASTELAEPMMKICAPFRLNSFSEKVALEALGDDDFVREIALVARTERRWVSEELRKLGMIVYPSETNFILFRSRIPVDELVSLLLEKKIAIRNCGNQPMLDNCARVTIGRREINEIFIEAMKKIVRDAE